MRIGVLGAGNMADALGGAWARAGHEVMVGARDRGRADALAARIGAAAGGLADAAVYGDVVLLAVPYGAAEDVVRAVGPWQGKVLVDCTNPIGGPDFRLLTAGGASGAERIAAAAPGAHVVKAFNLVHEGIWRAPRAAVGGPLGVPLCGDDAGALAAVRGLVRDLGCEPVDGGGLARAGQLEATAAFVIGVWFGGGDPAAMLPPVEVAMGGRPHA
ncbi:NADPH-dependent F420 reductase [Actinomadura parmotrematis]|uniref:NAD(P)-binding domain-containing protein n=1 Tax=Actinomadura parmotrematis TaxID=2864039 RepID=A0ABS7FVW6_9ACTN|nr:NAD(P)-binding domain-containing protein [Actinomadura parmotrematis]MBW8484471.1 NAD(P)-binding domain-containing protein [Actinomadura parmotrematis]